MEQTLDDDICITTYIPSTLKNGAYKSENILQKYIALSIPKCVVFNKALKMIMGKMGVCRMFNSSLRQGVLPDYSISSNNFIGNKVR